MSIVTQGILSEHETADCDNSYESVILGMPDHLIFAGGIDHKERTICLRRQEREERIVD